jgi:hypothetical protein
MKPIETTIEVDNDAKATVQLPAGAKPGTHRAVVIVFDRPEAATVHSDFSDFPRHDVQVNLPEGFTFRREQIYDDSGRGA